MANEKLVNRENLKAYRQKYDERLTSGQLVVSKSLTAKELETISPESGDTQETPFALQGTGTANGTSSVDTGTVGKHIQKQGSVYCVNQWAKSISSDNYKGYNATATFSDGVATFTASQQQGFLTDKSASRFPIIYNHKYLTVVKVKTTTATNQITVRFYNGSSYQDFTLTSTTNAQIIQGIVSISTNGTSAFRVQDNRSSDWDAVQVSNVQFIDLTQWFNGNIPQDLLDHPEHWSWYQTYGDYIPYNTGELVASNGKYLVCGGRNIWDGTIEGGGIGGTGQDTTGADNFRTKEYISVIPSKSYNVRYNRDLLSGSQYLTEYDENHNFIRMSSGYAYGSQSYDLTGNTHFIRVQVYKSGSNWYSNTPTKSQVELTISLYYAGEDYSQYYPYEQPKVYDTGDEELLSTGVKLSVSGEREDIYDYKEPDGTITRRVGSIVLDGSDDENWSLITSGFFNVDNIISGSPYTVSDNSISAIDYEHITQICGSNSVFQNATTNYTKAWQKHYNGTGFRFKNSNYSDLTSWKTYLSNNPITLYYELATETTEQGTPFSENIEIDDFGTMGWYATYTDANTNALVSVPQGCKIFYPAWYVGFIDTLGQRADIDWNANNVVSQSELGVETTNRTSQDTILQNAIGGTLRQLLAISQSIDFLNTAFIDLGTLTWGNPSTAYGVKEYNSNALSGIKIPADNNTIAKIVCSSYKANKRTAGVANCIMVASDGSILITDQGTYTGTEFKNAMKGVLLAYEKA